jgi:hypothetical protein
LLNSCLIHAPNCSHEEPRKKKATFDSDLSDEDPDDSTYKPDDEFTINTVDHMDEDVEDDVVSMLSNWNIGASDVKVPSTASVKQFQLLLPHYVGEWEDDEVNKRATIVCLVPASDPNDYQIKVAKGGRALQLVMDWPDLLLDPREILRQLGLALQGNNMAIALFKAVKGLRSNLKDGVKSCMKIPLPFKCEEQLCSVDGCGLGIGRFGSGSVRFQSPGTEPVRFHSVWHFMEPNRNRFVT